MAPVTIDGTGVGEYDARGGKPIPAHHYAEISRLGRKGHDNDGLFAMHWLGQGTRLTYPRIRGVSRTADLVLRLATGPGVLRGASVSVRLGDESGPQLCSVALPATGGFDVWEDIICRTAKPLPSVMTLVLVFQGEGLPAGDASASATESARLASFSFREVL